MSRIARRTVVPVNQITPLTYRDGVTYIQMLTELSEYVKSVLHPSLQHTVDELVADVEAQMDKHHDQYVDGVQEFQRIHDAFMSDVNARLIALNDGAVSDLVQDETSLLSQVLHQVFVRRDQLDEMVSNHILDDASFTASSLEQRIRQGVDKYTPEPPEIEDFSVYITPEMFGAVGDGVHDDTEALTQVIQDGRPVLFDRKTYRITRTIEHSFTESLHWFSQGATIVLDSDTPLPLMMDFTLNDQSFYQYGEITLDGQRNSYGGVSLINANGDNSTVISHHLTIQNIYRGGTLHRQGDGLNIRGGFNSVGLYNLTLRNIVMAPGAVVTSPQLGISGVYINDYDGYYPKNVVIDSPFIDGVYSEDKELSSYQNGLRLFSRSINDENSIQPDTSFRVINGYFRNCGGRAIKVQAGWVVIHGVHIVRQQQRTRGNHDIDIQMSGGTVRDVNIHHIGQSCQNSVVLQVLGTPINRRNHMNLVSGVRVFNHSDQSQRAVINVRHHRNINSRFIVESCEHVGNPPDYFAVITPADGGTINGVFDKIFSSPLIRFVQLSGPGSDGTSPVRGSISFSNIFSHSRSNKPIVGVSNFTSASWDGQFLFSNIDRYMQIPSRIDDNGYW